MKLDNEMNVISQAIEEYKLDAIFALFSGGHDSVVATHVASQHPAFAGVIHIDTMTGLPETEQYVRDVVERYQWPLIVKQPVVTYEMQLVKEGFPGPAMHHMMYRYLKERPLMQAKQDAKRQIDGTRIGFTTGVRLQESNQRMGYVTAYRKDGKGIWINPVFDWSKRRINQYMTDHNVPRSPVVDTMHMSGECYCGAYARRNEKRELAFWFPQQAEKIQAWEALVQRAKELNLLDVPERYCRWGWKDTEPDEQLEMFPLCVNCRGNDSAQNDIDKQEAS